MEIYEVMQQFDIATLKKINDAGRNKGAESDDLFWVYVSSLNECVNGVMSRELIGGISEEEKLDLFTSIVAATIMAYDALTEREKGEMSSSVAKANGLMKKTLEKIVDISEKYSDSFSVGAGMIQ